MSTNRKPSLVLVAFVFCASCVPALGQSARAKAEQLTVALMQLNAQYRSAATSGRAAILTQLNAIAIQRQQLLSSLIQTDPAEVLKVALPSNVRTSLPSQIQSLTEQNVVAQGVLQVLVEMNGTPDKTTGVKMHYGLTTAQQRLELHFASNAPVHLLTGSVVRVQGVQVGNNLALASGSTNTTSSSLQVVTSASLPNTFGQTSTLVMLVNFLDNSNQPETPASVQDAVFNQTSNWDMENSFQQTWLTGSVAGWFPINLSLGGSTCSSTFTNSVKSDAKAAAQAAGYNLSSYSHFIYVMSDTPCTWWGYASIGGGDVWINGKFGVTRKVVSHEMGHNFGLYHSHTMDCGTAVTCSGGTVSEYGDWIDTMGASQAGHYNSFQKERLGWLNGSAQPPITTVTSSGIYQISPYEVQDSNPKALKILQSGSSNSYYYVEYRQAQGQDSFLSSHPDILSGVVVHLASPSNSNSSDLLDLTPTSPSSFSIPALVAGQSYTDSAAGVTITPTAITIMGATVQVNFGTATCTNANPTVSISPLQSQYVTAGTPVNFTFTVKDNDSSSCAASTFNLSETLPSGCTGVWNPSALMLSPGTSGSATLTVTSPSGAADGFYNVGVGAANAAAPSYSGSVSATYVISTPAPVSISVSTNQSTYTAGQNVYVTVTLLSGSSPDAGVSVNVSITKPNGTVASFSGTTGSNGIAVMKYRLKRQDPVGTYDAQAMTSVTGASSTMGASTVFVVQ